MVVFTVYAVACALSLSQRRRRALLPETATHTADQSLS
jgi:hypothetical protein